MSPDTKRAEPMTLSPDAYSQTNQTNFERSGYFENDSHREVDSFGKIAQVYSTFVSRHSEDAAPYARGINSLQLVNDGQQGWIVSHPQTGAADLSLSRQYDRGYRERGEDLQGRQTPQELRLSGRCRSPRVPPKDAQYLGHVLSVWVRYYVVPPAT